MENTIIFATGNEGKMREIRSILSDTGYAVMSMKEAGIQADITEDGKTFEENALIKARAVARHTKVKNQNLIDRLAGVEDEKRTARFVCAIAAVFPDGEYLITRGEVEGRIGYEERGEGGFGYDPVFYLPEYGKSTAELTEEEKNAVSHRGKALRRMKEELQNKLQ